MAESHKKTKQSDRGRGRPSPYDAKLHPVLARCAARSGYTATEIAQQLGVAESTLHLWAKRHPEFSEAINDGREFADGKVEDSLFRRAMGYVAEDVETTAVKQGGKVIEQRGKKVKRHVPPDVTACIFWLKNRKPKQWRDRQELTHSAPDGGPVRVEVLRETMQKVLSDPKAFEQASALGGRLGELLGDASNANDN